MVTKLTSAEKEALSRLKKEKWGAAIDLERDDFELDLMVPIKKVAKLVAKSLKPGRTLLTAVRFSGGGVIEELSGGAAVGDDEVVAPSILATAPVAAVTVAAPTIGCPMPEFAKADVRATEVLKTFLTASQLADFEEHQQFVVVGADTGHRYLLTSRHSLNRRNDSQTARSVYDLDDRGPVCVHDWSVPAAEELLGLALFIQLPGRETYCRELPE